MHGVWDVGLWKLGVLMRLSSQCNIGASIMSHIILGGSLLENSTVKDPKTLF